MKWQSLRDVPSWEWPPDSAAMLLAALRDRRTSDDDLVLAAELAGDFVIINDDLAAALLALLRSGDHAEAVRGQAATSLAPVLEAVDEAMGLEDVDELPVAAQTAADIRATLRGLYADARLPDGVRRCILEASVRAPEEWHPNAIRAAYSSADEAWRLTAVFCMRFVRGFDRQIVEALDSSHLDVRRQAVGAAGTWEIDAAWPHLAEILASAGPDKLLLLEAITAAASIRPQEALDLLADLASSGDEEIAEAVDEAMQMAALFSGELDDPDDEP